MMNGAAAFFHPRYGWFLMLTIIQFVKDVMHLLCVGLAILDPEARYGQICQNVKFHSGSPSIVCTLDIRHLTVKSIFWYFIEKKL